MTESKISELSAGEQEELNSKLMKNLKVEGDEEDEDAQDVDHNLNDQQEVWKSPNSNCYIVFGEAKTEDTAAGLSNLTGGGGLMGGGGAGGHANSGFQSDMMMSNSMNGKQPVLDVDDGDVDETGVDPADIDTILSQVSCSRARAVRALKEADGDLINAIIAAS